MSSMAFAERKGGQRFHVSGQVRVSGLQAGKLSPSGDDLTPAQDYWAVPCGALGLD